jgi:hypothetical protein
MIPNYDPATGIHYGVISPHTPNPDAVQDIYDSGDNLSYAAAIEQIKDELESSLQRVLEAYGLDERTAEATSAVWETVEQEFNDHYEEQDDQYQYEQDGYILQTSSLGIYVIKSPYYTFAAACSPCCPNAGDLDTPRASGLKTYCLGVDWFDKDNPVPYPVYSVDTNVEIFPDTE